MIRSIHHVATTARRFVFRKTASAMIAIVAMSLPAAFAQETKDVDTAAIAAAAPAGEETAETEAVGPSLPWDYLPYRVLVWIASDDTEVNAASVEVPLRKYLDLDFSAVWRMDIADAPTSVRSAARRDMGSLTYDSISASDPVIAVKRDHPEAVRIRTAADVGQMIKEVHGTQGRIDQVLRRGADSGNETIDGVADRFVPMTAGDEVAVQQLWANKEIDAILVSRGMASSLDDPDAKLISPPIAGLVGEAIEAYDKIFIVSINRDFVPNTVSVVEIDSLMRHFGPVAKEFSRDSDGLVSAIGRGVARAFAPVVRIENAGQRNASGLLRAGGLILDPNSPANVRVNDVLEPMTRKNDRNGKPILIGAIDWAFLHVTEPEISVVSAVKGTGLQVGDQVLRVADKKIQLPQEIEHGLEGLHDGDTLKLEVDRGGKKTKVGVKIKGSSTPIRMRYLGFTAGERRGEVIVASVIPKAPAEGKLMPRDVIVAVGKTKLTNIASMTHLVASSNPNQPIKLSVKRDGAAKEVVIEPNDVSQRKLRSSLYMEYYAGRPGGLQGRKNNRTFRTALKVRAFGDQTLVRLHAKGDKNFPLIGYEIYQKEVSSTDMTFVGRTDWDGRLNVDRTKDTLRLLYVKNGGSVLARLPTVPGLTAKEVADISGDDMRLQAEAYIRGVQNAIIDLVAVRELFKARIYLRLRKGTPEDFEKAKKLFEALRAQPSNEKLALDMGKKQDMFIKLIGRNANQRSKVDGMFKITRELLSKHIGPKLVDDIELDVIAAEKNGGKLPPDRDPAGKEE